MPHIARFIVITAPVETVFEFVADYRNIPRLQPHFDTVRPTTAETRGLGAQLDLHGRFLGMPITAHTTIISFEPPHLLISDSTGGVRSRSTWRFTAVPPATPGQGPPTTRAGLTVDYDLTMPGGRLLGGMIQPELVNMTVDSLQRLKRLLEGQAPPEAPR